MGIIKSTVQVGQKPPKEIIKAVKEIARRPIHYTEDCPESTPEALAEFAALRAQQKKNDLRPVIAIRLMPDVLAKYKALGKGYTGIMAEVLSYAANNPEFLKQMLQ